MGHSNPSLALLSSIWERAKENKQAKEAIEFLKRERLDLETMWQAIAIIPLLPKRRSRSRSLRVPRGTRSAVRFLREMGKMTANPDVVVEARDEHGTTYSGRGVLRQLLKSGQLADSLEKALGCRWVLTEANVQQNALATLRWEVKWRAKKSYDRQLSDVLDAVFRAAGEKYSESHDTFRKSLDHELQVRKASLRKFSQ
jgi:hypothetical protein